MSVRALKPLGLLVLLALISACASAPKPVKSADVYFKEGEAAYNSRDYEEAINLFKKVKESYSSPELSTQAELKIADAHYDNKAYIEAAAAYEDFRKLHPTNEKAPYALYRLGLSHYHQIAGIDTDQTPVKSAVASFETFQARYPKSEYLPEVRQKLAQCRGKQLEYENYVGNFYLRTDKYPSAIKRLNEALVRFPNQPQRDATLFYLVKAHLKSGDKAKGAEFVKRLETEFPQSPYLPEAQALLSK